MTELSDSMTAGKNMSTPTPPPSIGILGGLGPYAGLDLVHKIFDSTRASVDQDHLPVMLYSFPGEIAPRVEFLTGTSHVNPGYAMGDIMVRLSQAGATVLGMPCNTAHSEAILAPALERLRASGRNVRFIHMIEATIDFLQAHYPQARKIAIFCTRGAFASGVFTRPFEASGYTVMYPDEQGRNNVQNAISNREYGIKAFSDPATEKACALLRAQALSFKEHGADIMLMGCTEVPLALKGKDFEGIPFLDPTRVLARALVNAFAPERLRPLD